MLANSKLEEKICFTGEVKKLTKFFLLRFLYFFLNSQTQQVFKKFLKTCDEEELFAKFLVTFEKIQEKDNIKTKLEKDLVNYEKQKLTVGQ